MFTPAERARLRGVHLSDAIDAIVEKILGPQCETVSAAGVRCVEIAGHHGECDVRPWRRKTNPNPQQENQHG